MAVGAHIWSMVVVVAARACVGARVCTCGEMCVCVRGGMQATHLVCPMCPVSFVYTLLVWDHLQFTLVLPKEVL